MPDSADPAEALLASSAVLQGYVPDVWTEGSHFDLAVRLDRIEHLIALLQERREWLQLTLADSMESDEEVTPVGVLRRHEKERSTWRFPEAGRQMREDLAAAVAHEVALDVGTGEVDPVKRNVALHALRTAYEAIPSFSSLKVTGLKRFRLRLEDYRSKETYYSVSLETID